MFSQDIEDILQELESGRDAAGVEDYEKALATAKETAARLIHNRQHDDAITITSRLRYLLPDDTDLKRLAALAQGAKGEFVLRWVDVLRVLPSAWLLSELELRFRLAIEIDPSLADPYWDMAVLKARFEGDFDESERLYQHAVELGYKHPMMPTLKKILSERKLPRPLEVEPNVDSAMRELLLELAAFPDRFAPGWVGPVNLAAAPPEQNEPAFDSYWRAAANFVRQGGLSVAAFKRVCEDVAKIDGDAGEYLHDLIRRVSFEYQNEPSLQIRATEAHLRILAEASFSLRQQSLLNDDIMMRRARKYARRGLRIIETTQSMVVDKYTHPTKTPLLASRAEIDAETQPAFKPVDLFFSYSHKDEKLRDKLETHLSLLRGEESIRTWHDRQIGIGTEFAEAIDRHIEKASIILLLVSADFLASEYCYSIEMKSAMKYHESGTARVIPVILRDCEWDRAPFAKLRVLPTDGKAVTGRKWQNQDEAFLDITRGIRAAIDELRVPLARISPHAAKLTLSDETEPNSPQEIPQEQYRVDPDLHADLLLALGQTYARVESAPDQLGEAIRYYLSALELKETANNRADVERLKELIERMCFYILSTSTATAIIGQSSSLRNIELAYEAAQLLDSDSLRHSLAIALGNQYSVVGQPQLAENLLRNVLSDPVLPSKQRDYARFTLASSLSEQGKGIEASKIQAALIAEDSSVLENPVDKAVLLMDYGNSLRIMGELKKANEAFENALESISQLDESNQKSRGTESHVRALLGEVLFLQGNVEKGDEEMQKALATIPDGLTQRNRWRYYSLAAKCYFNAKMYDKALPYLDQARQILNEQITAEPSSSMRKSLLEHLHDLEALTPPAE